MDVRIMTLVGLGVLALAPRRGSLAVEPFGRWAMQIQSLYSENADEEGIEESLLELWGRRRKLRLLGAGATRAVYLYDGKALKLDLFPGYQFSCASEAYVWSIASDRMRRSLVPVLDSGPGWLLMELVKVGGKLGDASYLREHGLTDFRPCNVSRDGRLLDYAHVWDAAALDAQAREMTSPLTS